MPKIKAFERYINIIVWNKEGTVVKLDTIANTTMRLRSEGYAVSEHALRMWVKQGEIPVIHSGKKALVLYEAVVEYILAKAS